MAGQGQNVENVPPKALAISPENFKQSDDNWLDSLLKSVGLKSEKNWQAQVANGKNNPASALGV